MAARVARRREHAQRALRQFDGRPAGEPLVGIDPVGSVDPPVRVPVQQCCNVGVRAGPAEPRKQGARDEVTGPADLLEHRLLAEAQANLCPEQAPQGHRLPVVVAMRVRDQETANGPQVEAEGAERALEVDAGPRRAASPSRRGRHRRRRRWRTRSRPAARPRAGAAGCGGRRAPPGYVPGSAQSRLPRLRRPFTITLDSTVGPRRAFSRATPSSPTLPGRLLMWPTGRHSFTRAGGGQRPEAPVWCRAPPAGRRSNDSTIP